MNKTYSNPITFNPFCDEAPVRLYRGHHLPHIRQDGCTYFVTFRLADSVPQGQLKQWKVERATWLRARGIDVGAVDWRRRFESLPVVERAVFERTFASRLFETLDDGLGDCILRNGTARRIVAKSLKFFDGSRFHLGDFVVMPNHVHALMTPMPNFELEKILHSIKSWSGNEVNKVVGRSGELWMKDSYDRLVRDGEELLRTQTYIRINPMKAKLSEDDFSLGSASYRIHD